MKLKKSIAIALCATTLVSFGVMCEAADKKASATPTKVAAVTVPQYPMNLDQNPNYVLVWHHLDTNYYLDLSSIIIKENDDKMRWWGQNIVEVDNNGKYIKQFLKEYCYDRTIDNTRQWNPATRQWENLFTYDTNSRNQLEVRAYNLSYMFAFQGGNPVEK